MISIVGWVVAILLTNAVFKLSELDAPAMLFITTAITGGGMVWLLRHRRAPEAVTPSKSGE